MLTKSNLRRLRVAASAEPAEPPPWEPRQLSGPRQELDRRIILLASAQKAAEAAHQPVERLSGVIAEHDRRLSELRRCHASDREKLAELIATGSGELTYTSPETAVANQAAVELSEAVEAARQAMPAAEQRQREAIAELAAATAARDQALLAVAEEACEQLSATMVDKLNAYLVLEAQLRSVAVELRGRGDRDGDNAAHRAATAIEALVTRTQQSAGVPHSDAGPRLLQALKNDPMAALS